MTTHFHDYSLVRLFHKNGPEIVHHIISLNDSDRYLRFGYNCSDEQIANYVVNSLASSEAQKNFWYGIFDGIKLIATIHIALGDDIAEFAFTTDSEYRGQKIGQLLFARGYQLVTEFQITRIYMCMLSKNAAMRHIAKKFGMSVMTHGTDSEASVNIAYPVPLSRLNEVKMCMICMIDKDLGK
jgi:RimJ/RimL family protein N-acetyltransferase